MYTWHDIKLVTLQKMFATEGNTIPTDEATMQYIYAMPYAANEALNLLSTSGKYLVKSFQLSHYPIANIVSDLIAKKIQAASGLSFDATKAKSFYVECSGTGTVTISNGKFNVSTIVDGAEVVTQTNTISISTKKGYDAVKALISDKTGTTLITFSSEYPFYLKNIALYETSFVSPMNVQAYSEYIVYPISDFADDFFQLDEQQAYFEGEGEDSYIKIKEYYQEGNKSIVLPRNIKGNFRIYYKAYPKLITSGTADTYELPIDQEVAVLLPLYMAAELYKDDDNGIATTYRNEFEAARDALNNNKSVPFKEDFTSESGWI